MRSTVTVLRDVSVAGSASLSLNARMAACEPHPSSRTPKSVTESPAHAPGPLPSAIGLALPRERLLALIDARLPGAVWLQGPTGAGKTVLLRSWLHRHGHPSSWLSVDDRHRDPAALFAALTAVAEPACTGGLPTFSPEHRDDPIGFARDYFDRLDQALPAGHALVVDDVHHLADATVALLALAIDRFGGRRVLCFASQLMPDAAFAPHVAGSRLWIVGHRLLAFDEVEANALAIRLGIASPAVDDLVAATDGWAAGLMLAMQFGAGGEGGGDADDPLGAVRSPLALLIAGQVLGGVAADDLVRLRLLAELPQVPMELVDVAPDWRSACSRLQSLSERGLFVERLAADRKPALGGAPPAQATAPAAAHPPAHPSNVTRIPKGCWRLHDLFRGALREPGSIGPPDLGVAAVLVRHLLATDRLDLAWQLAAGLDAGLLATVVVSHGNAALRDSHLPGMLQLVIPHARRSSPTIALWQARGLIGNDNAAALRAAEEAFAGCEDAADAAGTALSVAVALFVVFATVENVHEIAAWAARFAAVDWAALAEVGTPEERALRTAGEVVHDALVRGRLQDRDAECAMQDRLLAHVTAELLSANETILAGSLLVSAMRRAMRVQDAELVILRIEALSSYRRSAPHIRASWHVENGYYFTRLGALARARGCFDDALSVAAENALLQPRIGALVGLARLELGRGAIADAQAAIAALEALGQDRLGRFQGWVLHLRARAEVLSGRVANALESIERAERLILDAGFPQSVKVILDHDKIQMLHASGAVDAGLALAAQVMAREAESDAQSIRVTSGLLESHALWNDDRPRAAVLLERHLQLAHDLDLTMFVGLVPAVAAQIAARALQAGLAVDFVVRAIEVRGLPAPRDAPRNWPWPIRVEVLRPFRILRHGETMTFSGKAQQKPLELLKYLACCRDLIADASSVALALWPTADEAPAKKSLEVTVSRLRKLLEDDTLVIVKEGKVSLDPRRVTSDARAFVEAAGDAEAVGDGRHRAGDVGEIGDRLLQTFSEMPLEHEESTAWREAVRERYRAAFVRAVRALVAYWHRAGDAPRSAVLIEAAIAREPLAESLYRMLIQIHLDAGNATEAMRVYRQCRQMLSVLIGAQPSPETERLKTLINL